MANPSCVDVAEFAGPVNATDGFTVKFTVDLKPFDGEKTILEIPNVLSVRLRQHDPLDRNRQNYPAYRMPDGSVPVLEACSDILFHPCENPSVCSGRGRRSANVGEQPRHTALESKTRT